LRTEAGQVRGRGQADGPHVASPESGQVEGAHVPQRRQARQFDGRLRVRFATEAKRDDLAHPGADEEWPNLLPLANQLHVFDPRPAGVLGQTVVKEFPQLVRVALEVDESAAERARPFQWAQPVLAVHARNCHFPPDQGGPSGVVGREAGG
jgi:hypothetical protein